VSCDSNTATDLPECANSAAQERPAKPEPITTTSTSVGISWRTACRDVFAIRDFWRSDAVLKEVPDFTMKRSKGALPIRMVMFIGIIFVLFI
jgi:hypothetical protein